MAVGLLCPTAWLRFSAWKLSVPVPGLEIGNADIIHIRNKPTVTVSMKARTFVVLGFFMNGKLAWFLPNLRLPFFEFSGIIGLIRPITTKGIVKNAGPGCFTECMKAAVLLIPHLFRPRPAPPRSTTLSDLHVSYGTRPPPPARPRPLCCPKHCERSSRWRLVVRR